jgi:pSer/pThr/pTyr-binding forkhead associated (FHA) protein
MFKLVIQDDEGKTTVVPLIRDEITIGRKEGNTIRLTERNVSRRHARILRNNGEVQIEDLGSYNGIRVNNARIAERVSLRPSDQVQIGDYKLYLKAEGAEHADDSAARAHDRPDQAPTDVMSVPAGSAAGGLSQLVTAQVPAQLIGSPNRTQVSLQPIADTDPQGRPVASSAEVEKLMSPVGYGKLVGLSSNFAGKELELSRPQMIIGRTEDNDIVINHRSISRNHAKVVRDPDTGRYTISDLQSSNGVRVNGQDYGKVELRRGDVVDLGHVRLRFIEPGEDFVFARDAVITDVPESGGRRGLLVAVVLGVLVLAAAVAFVLMRDSGTPSQPGPSGRAGGGGHSAPGGSPPEPGPAGQVAAAAPADAAEAQPPADAAPPNPGSATAGSGPDIKVECLRHQADERWDDLDACADRLKPSLPREAQELKDRAVAEIKSRPRVLEVETALRDQDLRAAKLALDKISPIAQSALRVKTKYERAEVAAINDLVARLERRRTDCRDFATLVGQERASKPRRVVDEAVSRVRCIPEAPAPPPPRPACDLAALHQRAESYRLNGQFEAAITTLEEALECKSEPLTFQKIFINACNQRNVSKARSAWRRMSASARTASLSICIRNNITEDQLSGTGE